HADVACEHNGQLRPAKKKAEPGAKCSPKIDVITTGAGVGGGQLRVTKRTKERKNAAHDPQQQCLGRAGHQRKDPGWSLVNTRTNDDADNDADDIPQAQCSRWVSRGLLHAGPPQPRFPPSWQRDSRLSTTKPSKLGRWPCSSGRVLGA